MQIPLPSHLRKLVFDILTNFGCSQRIAWRPLLKITELSSENSMLSRPHDTAELKPEIVVLHNETRPEKFSSTTG